MLAYQRDVVWSLEKQGKLIDSLFANFYVPPIIFNVKIMDPVNGGPGPTKKRYTRNAIDGKQRLSPLKNFVRGNIPCKDKDGRKWVYIDNGDGRSTNVLPTYWRRMFDKKEVV